MSFLRKSPVLLAIAGYFLLILHFQECFASLTLKDRNDTDLIEDFVHNYSFGNPTFPHAEGLQQLRLNATAEHPVCDSNLLWKEIIRPRQCIDKHREKVEAEEAFAGSADDNTPYPIADSRTLAVAPKFEAFVQALQECFYQMKRGVSLRFQNLKLALSELLGAMQSSAVGKRISASLNTVEAELLSAKIKTKSFIEVRYHIAKAKIREILIDAGFVSPVSPLEERDKFKRKRTREQRRKMRQNKRKGSRIINNILKYNEEGLYYKVLGVRKSCSQEQLRKAYRKRSLLVHPDKNVDVRAHEAFDTLRDVYEVLADPSLRSEYNVGLEFKEKSEKEEMRKRRKIWFERSGKIMTFFAKYIHVITISGVILFFLAI